MTDRPSLPAVTTRWSYVAVLLAAVACARDPQRTDESPAPTAEGSPTRLAYDAVRKDGALLLDVRTRQEFESERIDGAHNIPVDELGGRLAEVADLAHGRDKPVVVHCSSGVRSARAKQTLVGDGFRSVIDLGALRDWPYPTEILRGGAR